MFENCVLKNNRWYMQFGERGQIEYNCFLIGTTRAQQWVTRKTYFKSLKIASIK